MQTPQRPNGIYIPRFRNLKISHTNSQDPTLTMMALTVRACGHLVEQARQGELG